MLCKIMKKHKSAAVMMLLQLDKSLPLVVTSVEIVPFISTPKSDPITLPTPPVKRVPPITDEAIAFISKPRACCTEPDIVFIQ